MRGPCYSWTCPHLFLIPGCSCIIYPHLIRPRRSWVYPRFFTLCCSKAGPHLSWYHLVREYNYPHLITLAKRLCPSIVYRCLFPQSRQCATYSIQLTTVCACCRLFPGPEQAETTLWLNKSVISYRWKKAPIHWAVYEYVIAYFPNHDEVNHFVRQHVMVWLVRGSGSATLAMDMTSVITEPNCPWICQLTVLCMKWANADLARICHQALTAWIRAT